MLDVPASTGHGEPIQKLFKLRDGERIVAAVSFDPRLLPAESLEGAEEAGAGLRRLRGDRRRVRAAVRAVGLRGGVDAVGAAVRATGQGRCRSSPVGVVDREVQAVLAISPKLPGEGGDPARGGAASWPGPAKGVHAA